MLHAGGYTAALGAQLALLYCAVRAGQDSAIGAAGHTGVAAHTFAFVDGDDAVPHLQRTGDAAPDAQRLP